MNLFYCKIEAVLENFPKAETLRKEKLKKNGAKVKQESLTERKFREEIP